MRAKVLEKDGVISFQLEAQNDEEAILMKLFKAQVGASSHREHRYSALIVTKGEAEIQPFYKGFWISPKTKKGEEQ